MRPAGQTWEKHYSDHLGTMAYLKGKAAPTVFVHKEKEVYLVVHGDDFTFLGEGRHLKEAIEMMKEWYDIKVRGILGGGENDSKEIDILNRKSK